jgi:CDP-glucose 4,6-dehydratase
VLEPLSGYIMLAEKLLSINGNSYANSWNFGPDISGDATVGDVVKFFAEAWGERAKLEFEIDPNNPHEAGLLRLDINRARSHLGWLPRLSLKEAIQNTIEWYRGYYEHKDMKELSIRQIQNYENLLKKMEKN